MFIGLELTWTVQAWALLASLFLFVAANGVVAAIIVRLPADHFCRPRVRLARGDRHWVVHWAIVIGRNVFGGLAVLVGIVLSLPGVPGPGVVLILIGTMMLDFPGKHRLIQNLVRRPSVLRNLNRLRARYGRPPLLVDPP